MYKPERILAGAPNARDLGGIKTLDGKTVKHGRLIRSGALWCITDDDILTLGRMDLRTVVDFRTMREKEQRPDRVIPGAVYIDCPMLEQETDGITRSEPLTDKEEALQSIRMAQKLMSFNPDGRAQMKSLYPLLVTLEHSVTHYKKFFELLLEHEEGALLYHCSMGKDRVGVASALILSALGASRESIVADYVITSERCAAGTERLIKNCSEYTDDAATLEFVRWLDMSEAEFIEAALDTVDAKYGSMDNFLRDRMGLTDDKLARLRKLYLE